MRKTFRYAVVLVTFALAIAGVTFIIKASDGALSGQYALSGTFASSGEGLHAGSAVSYQGVQVGRVTGIALDHGKALVSMAIDPNFHVPADATATIEPINVFGADDVKFDFAPSDSTTMLAPGATVGHTSVSPELGDLFAAADPLLAQIDAPDLATIVSNLAQGSQGEGPTIAQGIQQGVKLADLLDRTLPEQLNLLDSLNGASAALVPTAQSFNAIATALNQGLPDFNAHAAQYEQLLAALQPFAENFAQLLSAYHPDFATLLSSGDDVARVLLVRQQDIGNIIQGLGLYLTKFANAVDPQETLPDGSHFGYFHTFILLSDVNSLVCGLLAPAQPNLSFLEPLQQALAGAGSPLNCSSQMAAFDALQNGTGTAGTSTSTNQAGQSLSTQLYQGLAQPQKPASTGLGGLIDTLLGGGL